MSDLYASFRDYLKKELPLPHPVTVRRVKMSADYEGYCTFDGQQFGIKINAERSDLYQIESLQHEWAHALDFCREGHGRSWGVQLAKVYRAFEKWTQTEDEK